MRNAPSVLRKLLLALWTGSGAFLLAVAAPAAFRAAPSRAVAADVVGAMLTPWHYLAILAPLFLLLLEWYSRRLSRTFAVILFSTAAILAATQAAVDLRIRDIRRSSVSVSSLAQSHPLRRQFGLLHGASSALMLVQVLIAASAIVSDE